MTDPERQTATDGDISITPRAFEARIASEMDFWREAVLRFTRPAAYAAFAIVPIYAAIAFLAPGFFAADEVGAKTFLLFVGIMLGFTGFIWLPMGMIALLPVLLQRRAGNEDKPSLPVLARVLESQGHKTRHLDSLRFWRRYAVCFALPAGIFAAATTLSWAIDLALSTGKLFGETPVLPAVFVALWMPVGYALVPLIRRLRGEDDDLLPQDD